MKRKMYKMLKNKEADEEEMGIVFDISGNIHSYFSLPTYFHALDLIRNTMQSIGWNIILTLKSIPSSN